ncbi:MAG TPA: zf-HC2 domain-containing protein [Candidatus Deferrimicrobiaceae bacterium]
MKTNSCRKHEELMARYLHGEILRHERISLENHLAGCDRCSAHFEDVTGIDRLLRSLPPAGIEPPPWLHARIMASLPEAERTSLFARWAHWGWSLAAASVGAVLAVALMRGGQPPEPVRTAAVSPSGISSPVRLPAPTVPDSVPAAPAPAAPAPVPAPAVPAEPARVASKAVAAEPAEAEVRVIREVKIYLYAPSAQRVAVTGDFNGWDAKGVDLKPAGKQGMWEADLELSPGAYAYNFIVDGDVLVPDPNAPNQMPDGFGGTNSILLVKEGAPA